MNKLNKIIEYGLYALVFLLPWQTKLILRQGMLNRGPWEYGTIALYGTDILLIGLLIVFAVQYFFYSEAKPRDDKKNRGIVIILSGLDLFIFISTFFAPDTVLAIYRYVLFLLGLGLFWLVLKTEFSRKKMAIAFFSGLFIQSCLAIWQFLNQGTFAFKWLGLAAHSPGDLGVSVIETAGADGVGERWLRAYGSLDSPNILGGLLAIGLIIIFWIIINDQRIARKKTDAKFIFYILSLIIFAVGLIFSFSRSAWLGFAVGIVIFLAAGLFKKDQLKLKKIGGVILLLAVLSGLIFINYQNLFITRAQGTARLEVKSFSERKMYLSDSFNLIKKNWLFGSGIGNYTKTLAVKEPQRPWYYLQPVHNTFLLVWAETGIFGLLFFIALLGFLFLQSVKKKNILSLSILSILAIIMIFDHYLWSLHFGILFFWIIIGFIYKNLINVYGESKN